MATKITLLLSILSSPKGEVEHRVIGPAVVEVWGQVEEREEVLDVSSYFLEDGSDW